jgi:hypothetical protein
MKNDIKKELNFCLELWEKKWGCNFWWWTKCNECATPYILLKILNWEILDWDIKRLNLNDWKKKYKTI